jgi:ATP-dependent DNA helicase RecG
LGLIITITIEQMSEEIGVTPRYIERNIQKLQKEKIIKRIGPVKGKYWEVVDEDR